MSENDPRQTIINNIEEMRARLDRLVILKGLGSNEVLAMSQELDLIIIRYLKDYCLKR